MLFAICADRGAPGSTTTASVLAAARGLPAVVVEADPYGGDLALRLRPDGKHPLPPTPTVLGVAARRSPHQRAGQAAADAAQHGEGGRQLDLWRDGSHPMSEHVRVVPGFLSAEQGTSLPWPALAATLETQTVPVFADVGRIHTGSPSMPILTAADAVIAVCRADVASVQHTVDRLEALAPVIAERSGRTPLLLPVVVAPRKHGTQTAKSVSDVLARSAVGPAVRYVGWLAWDPAAVAHLEAGADPWEKPLRNSPLMRSARKTLNLIGLAAGLDHAEPPRRRRSRSKPDEPVQEEPSHETPAPGGREDRDQSDPPETHPAREHAWARPTPASVGQRSTSEERG